MTEPAYSTLLGTFNASDRNAQAAFFDSGDFSNFLSVLRDAHCDHHIRKVRNNTNLLRDLFHKSELLQGQTELEEACVAAARACTGVPASGNPFLQIQVPCEYAVWVSVEAVFASYCKSLGVEAWVRRA